MTHAFVSYVRDNEAEVRSLVDALRRAGVDVWFDRDSLQAGSRWQEAIAAAIGQGACFIACYSGEFAARDRTYMHDELAVARAMLKRPLPADRRWFLPVLVGGASAADAGLARDPDFGALHCIDFHRDPVEAVRQLLSVVSPERAMGRCLNVLPPQAPGPGPAQALFALDFGTSNSLLALSDPERGWTPVRDAEGRVYFPTTITFADNWDYWIGGEAVAAAYRRPDRCITGVKRLLARGEDACMAHKRFDPVTLASLVLRHMRECAERQFGRTVDEVVIAAPAEYTVAQVTALLRACERAGLRVARFIPEPNAAALLAAQWLETRPDLVDKSSVDCDAAVMVIDIGGGTTDVSLLQVAWVDGEWQFEVMATFGDNELGGMDYDEALRRHLRAALLGGADGAGLVWTVADDARLLDQARQAKERLAVAPVATVTLPDVQTAAGELRTLHLELDRETARTAFEAVDARLRQMIEAAGTEVERGLYMFGPLGGHPPHFGVLLAGQGSKLWTVAEFLAQRFPKAAIETGFQESAVCRGLALQTAVLQGQRPDLLLLDATTLTIGMRYLRRVERLDGRDSFQVHLAPSGNPHVTELVRLGTTIPTKFSHDISTAGPGLLSFELLELDRAHQVVGVLATLELQLEAGRHAMQVVVDIGTDRRMTFGLHDRKRGTLATAELRLSSG